MQEDVYQGNELNLYAYCHNNPVVYYDPSGYMCGELGNIGDGSEDSVGFKREKETFYRTMSQEDYDQLLLTREIPPTRETFISPTQSFSSNYKGIIVKFEVKEGTTNSLREIGVSNNSAQSVKDYGVM